MAMLDTSAELEDSFATPVVSGVMESFPDVEGGSSQASSAGLIGSSGGGGGGFFPCFSIAFYQPYFNVETSDVKDRLLATLKFYKSEPTFLNLVGDAPDLYGPFWIASTLIFIISVTSNFAKSLQDGLNYDFELVTGCLTLVFGYLAGLPTFLWAASKYWLQIPQLGLIQMTCLVGYSLFLWFPAALLSTANSLAWLSLLASGAASTLFLLRSLKPIFEPRREKGMSVVGVLVLLQLLFLLFLKLGFYSHTGPLHEALSTSAAAAAAVAMPEVEDAPVLQSVGSTTAG